MNETIKQLIDDLSSIPESTSEAIDIAIGEQFPHLDYDVFFTGEFDSTGYSIECYGVAWIDDNHELQTYSFQKEFK